MAYWDYSCAVLLMAAASVQYCTRVINIRPCNHHYSASAGNQFKYYTIAPGQAYIVPKVSCVAYRIIIRIMEAKPDEILRDKENKIKQLFSEFESLKKKIFVCEQ